MSAETDSWIADFTGLPHAGSAPKKDAGAEAAAADAAARMKHEALVTARVRIDAVKTDFQKVMEREVKLKDSYFKDKQRALLKVDGTQIDEADFTEIDFGAIELSPEASAALARGSNAITNESERLKSLTIVRDGKPQPLFTVAELQAEFWTPLVRERVLPETLVGDMYSKTKEMLDATNRLYEEAISRKKAEGKLTPEWDKGRDAVETGVKILEIGAEMTSVFGAGSANAKRAVDVLNLVAKSATGGLQVYDKVKAKKYADAASGALSSIQLLGEFAMGQAGLPKASIDAMKAGISVSKAAIEAGDAFAQGVDGVPTGLEKLGAALKAGLNAAADQTPEPHKSRLKAAAVGAPAVLETTALAMGLPKKIEEGDYAGITDTLTKAGQKALSAVQDIRKIEADKNPATAEERKKAIDRESTQGKLAIDLTNLTGKSLVAAATMAKKGVHLQNLNGVMDSFGNALGSALTTGGMDSNQAAHIASIYRKSCTAVQVFDALCNQPPDQAAALKALSSGIPVAFGAAAPNDKDLKSAADAIEAQLRKEGAKTDLVGMFEAGQFDAGIDTFVQSLQLGAVKVFQDPSVKTLLGAAAKKPSSQYAKGLAMEKAAADEEEAAQIVRQGRTAAEQAGIDASNIDSLIGRIERDRAIWDMAVMIVEGGTAFAASFVPALGGVGMAARLAANMVAAGDRLQQYLKWADSKRDFEAAQSELTSASQNFVKNQRAQFIHYTLQSVFKAAEMIGNTLKVAAVAGPAAQALEVTAKASGKIEAILYEKKKRYDLEKAWSTTKASFANPANRRLGLAVRALNPTLAKYTIAWGAVVKKDALARNAMAACQLNEATLENDGSNVDKVVDYLERFYRDDDQLYREIETTAKWVPAELELTLSSWTQVKQAAVKSAGLLDARTAGIDACLVILLPELSGLDAAGLDRREAALRRLEGELKAYRPAAKGEKEAKALGDTFAKICAVLSKQIRQGLDDTAGQREVLVLEAAAVLGLDEVAAEAARFRGSLDPDAIESAVSRCREALAKGPGEPKLKGRKDVEAHAKPVEDLVETLTGRIQALKNMADRRRPHGDQTAEPAPQPTGFQTATPSGRPRSGSASAPPSPEGPPASGPQIGRRRS